MFIKFILISFLLIITSCHKNNPVSSGGDNQQTTENKWVEKTSMPTARAYLCGAEVNGKIYLFGGIKDLSGHNSDDVESYDPDTDTWTMKNKMPGKIFGQVAVELNGELYVFGGRTGDLFNGTTLKYTYLYDPSTDSWTRKADMPGPRAFMAASVINEKIYIIGGSTSGFYGSFLVQMYDPIFDTWMAKASLEIGRAYSTSNVYNGKIYVIGGGTSSTDAAGTAYPNFDIYEPLNDSWAPMKDIPQARIGHGSAILNGKLYICGGFTSDNIELKDLNEYDFNNDNWTIRASMPSYRRCFVSSAFNNKFFIFGGISGGIGAQQILKSVLEYTPTSQ